MAVEEAKEDGKRNQKRETTWGPVERIPRLRRYQEDGKTTLQRALELKMYKNLEKGYRSFSFEINVSLLNKAQCVSLVVGSDSLESDVVINNLKQKDCWIAKHLWKLILRLTSLVF
jgi:hypothetical protein